MEPLQQPPPTTNTDDLVKRYHLLKSLLAKQHFCGYHFRQRCLHYKEQCEHAHGFSDMKRLYTSQEVLAMKMELFNLKVLLSKADHILLFNPKSKKYEIFKKKDLDKLRALKNGEEVDLADNIEEEEDDAPDE